MRNSYLIVGLDPGTTTGLAVLDINGKLLLLRSYRQIRLSKLRSIINSLGTPLIISSDRSSPPQSVIKFAQVVKAELYYPKSEPSVSIKDRIVSHYVSDKGVKIYDDHQRDALYSAVKAYQHYRESFIETEETVDKLLKKFRKEIINEIKARVVRGEPPASAFNSVLKGRRETATKDMLEVFRKAVASAKRSRERCEQQLKEALEEIKLLKRKLAERPHDKIIFRRESELSERERETIRELKLEVEKLRNELSLMEGKPPEGYLALKPVGKLTSSTLSLAIKDGYITKGCVIYASKVEGPPERLAEILERYGVSALVLDKVDDPIRLSFEKHGIAVLPSDELELEWRRGIPLVRSHLFRKLMKKEERQILEVYKEMLREIAEEVSEH